MDLVKARILEDGLKGKAIDGWVIEHLIDHGKSAAVFLGHRAQETAAVKIFDDELIKRYGDDTQLGRIKRELTLVGRDHPNLVKILSGGVEPLTKNHYIVMEYLDGPNLAKSLKTIPMELVPSLTAQLASAAKHLEELGLAHRDIKPENICLLEEFSRLVLLDFGVVRPVGTKGLTDGEGIQFFVGTLQYSSPEFLLRREDDSIDGWRALTFYQIGAVLHDLIMRIPIFHESVQPFARLVNAVQFEKPIIKSSDCRPNIVDLAERCLIKDPLIRLQLVNWRDFEPATLMATKSTDESKVRVTRRVKLATAQAPPQASPIRTERLQNSVRDAVLNYLSMTTRTIRKDTSIFPPVNVFRSPENGNKLRVRLGRSIERELHQDLTLTVAVSILDALAGAVSVTGQAYCGTTEPTASAPAPYRIFEGVYNSANPAPIYEAYEKFIYDILDVAQTLWASVNSHNELQPSWLTIDE